MIVHEKIHSYQWSVSNLFSSLLEQLLREQKQTVSINWKSRKTLASLKQKLILSGLHDMAGYIRTADATYLRVGMKNVRNIVTHNGDFVNGLLGKGEKSENGDGSYEHLERRNECLEKPLK